MGFTFPPKSQPLFLTELGIRGLAWAMSASWSSYASAAHDDEDGRVGRLPDDGNRCRPTSDTFNGCAGDGTFMLNRQFRFADIRDGLSMTLIVGERNSGHAPSTWLGVVSGVQHGVARVAGVAPFPPNSTVEPSHYFHNFSSFHPTGTNFLAADGSVRLIAETIETSVYHALATRAGGEVIPGY
jgi:prepilin-type processing-associated H-X9-DG protein